MRQKRFCHFCGTALEIRFFEGRNRLYCIACDAPLYDNPVPASCVVVADEANRILLVKRSVAPKIGLWCLPGGFTEIDETPETGAIRELWEETGLAGHIENLLGVTTHPSDRYGAIQITGYLVRHYSGSLMAGDDASDARFFDYSGLPEIAFDSHMALIRIFYAGYADEVQDPVTTRSSHIF